MLRKVLGVICLTGGLACVVAMVYYSHIMLKNVEAKHKNMLPFLGPLMLAIPYLWNKKGNNARVNIIISTVLFVVFFIGMAAVIEYLPME